MITSLRILHRPILIGLCTLFCALFAQSVCAQTYEINVGDKETLYAPNPPQGTIDDADWTCSNSNIGISKNGRGESADIKVNNYFSGTVTISCSVKYTWYDGSGSAGNRYKTGYTSKTYTIKAKPTEVKLSKTSLELEPGDEVELSYTTSPSGLAPEVEWRTTDKSVATLSSTDEQYYHVEKISYQKKVKVCANALGSCVIKLGCNTGYTAPTCSVTVKDDRPHVTANVPSGPVKKGTKVTLTCDRAGADIRYTTDGNDPTKNSQKFGTPIEINESMTLKAKAFVNSEESKVLTLKYTIVAHMPGEVFTSKSVEGVDITFKVVENSNSAYLQVGTGEQASSAISKSFSGIITIPNKVDGMTVKYIGKHAFYECNISDVKLSNTISLTVCSNAFYNCKKLTSLKSSPYSHLYLESFAFNNCESLNSVYFYSEVSQPTNHDFAFYYCDNIEKIYSYCKPDIIGAYAFDQKVYDEATLYVESEYLNQYKNYRGEGWKKFKNIVAIGSEPNPKLTLSASPSSGQVSAGEKVTLTVKADGSTVSGCDIYYTTNGTTPSKSNGTKYSSGITINSACTLKAIAYKSGYTDSDVLTEKYAIKEDPKPKLVLSASPNGGQVAASTKVTLTVKADGSTVSGCDIYYTLNGSTPSKSNGTKYSSGITINSACTLKAIAYKSGYTDSDVLTEKYTIKEDPKPKLVLSASPSSGQVAASTKVTLTVKADGSTVSGCDIYYTLNGSTPSKSNGTKYSSGITINNACTLKAIAYKSGYEDSDVLSETYTIKEDPKPKLVLSASPSGGQVSAGTTVTLTVKANGSTVSGCDIYYTTNGTTPSRNNGTKYSSGITINNACTLKAIANKSGYEDSDVLFTSYTIMELKIIAISAGFNHSLVLNNDGTLWACGQNGWGQLGDGTMTNRTKFKKIMSGVASVTAGSHRTTMIIKKDGSLWTCGENNEGQLGNGNNNKQLTPVKIMENVDTVAAGAEHMMILKRDGSLWACGSNSYGQFGDGATTSQYVPKKIMDRVISIAAGGAHTAIIKSDNTLWTCGNNIDGQLGNGQSSFVVSTPEKIMDGVAAVSAGYSHTIILKTDGTLWACGQGIYGALGNGGYTVYSPVMIMENVSSIASGASHNLVVKKDGTLWTFGYNVHGNLGDGTVTTSSTPKQIMSEVEKVAAGGYHSMILKKDGTLWSCGSNKEGELGDGTTTDKYSPVRITLPTPKLVLFASPTSGQIEANARVILWAEDEGNMVYGCDIYYTLNGTTPTKSSTKYTSSGITINNACTLKAIAYKDGYETSDVLTATFTIKENPKPKLTLTASPSGGQISAGTKVTLTTKANGSTVSGCDIYYTINGNTPTRNSTPYPSSGITINSGCTLKAIAYKSGYEDSDVFVTNYFFGVDPNFYIYICFGQSNMEGNAQPEAIDMQGIDQRFQLLATCNFTNPERTMGNWYKAIPPLVSPNGGLGPTDYFGRTMVEKLPDVKIGVIPVALGGSPIEMFDKDKYLQKLQQNPNEWWAILAKNHYGGNPYGRIIEMAKKAQEVGVIKGILLHQGCSNCGDPNWPNMVKKIYNDMLTDLSLSADSVPIFVGEVKYQDQGGGCSSHNAVVAEIPSVIPTSHIISAKGIPGNGSDPWHFSAAGYRMFGRRYAVSALTLMGVEMSFFSFFEGDFEPDTNCTYDANTRTMTALKSGGMVSWTYENAANWSTYKHLVVKLKEEQTANAEIIFFKTISDSGHREDIKDRTTVVIDLKNLKNGSDPSKVYKLAFRANQAGKIVFDDIFLSNDEQYDQMSSIHDVNSEASPNAAPLYSLDGRHVQPNALKPGIYIRSGKKLVIK